MSEEIVERLKAEGQLTRNTGTNSIRAVRIQMDKFEAIFETISEQVTLQTKLLADMVETSMDQLRINAETSEREKARQQREDLADAQEEDRDEPDDAAPARAEREGPGLFSMLGGMGIGKLLMGGALLGAGLFAAYNIAKGFIDQMYNGAWTNFEKGLVSFMQGVDFASIGNDLKSIAESIAGLASFLESFNFGTAVDALSFGLVSRMILKSALPPHLKAASIAAAAIFFGLRGDGDEGGSGTIEKSMNFLSGGTPIFESDEEEAAYRSGSLQETNPSRAAEITDQLNAAAQERQELLRPRTGLFGTEYTLGGAFADDYANDIRKINEILGTDYEIPGRSPEEEAAREEQLRLEEEARRSQELRDAAREYARRNQGLFNPDVYVEQFERKRRTDEFNRSMEAQDTPYDVEELSSSLYDEAMRNADRFFTDPNNYKATIGSSGPSTFEQIQQMLADFERDPKNYDPSKYQFGNDERVSEAAQYAIPSAVALSYSPSISVAPISVQGAPNISSNVIYGSAHVGREKLTFGNYLN